MSPFIEKFPAPKLKPPAVTFFNTSFPKARLPIPVVKFYKESPMHILPIYELSAGLTVSSQRKWLGYVGWDVLITFEYFKLPVNLPSIYEERDVYVV